MEISTQRDCFPVLKLPNEILRMIMEKASERARARVPTNSYRNENEAVLPYYDDLVSLALVCSRLNAAATEALYSCICIYADEYRDTDRRAARLSTCRPVSLLHRTLRENVQLRRYCNRFIFVHRRNRQMGDPVEPEFLRPPLGLGEPHQRSIPWPKEFASIILDCTNWLFNTRVLTISGHAFGTWLPETDITYRLLSCGRMSMPRLECIEILNDISYHRDVLTLYDIQLALSGGFLNLKHLTIRHRVRKPSNPRRSNAPGSLSTYNPCSGFSLSSLTLINSADHPDLVRNFVTWLKDLKHFTLRWDSRFRFGSRRDPQWSLALVGDILKPHRDSIKSIKLGMMSQPGLGDFDASNFPNLETLTMHHRDLRGIVISTCQQLQAARLHDVVVTTDDIEEEMFYNA
ncbi:hypothetical protein FGLOB1_490 [Fusarium globosum]|uniref:F-box domain-containing protein n=1 Tax=Fusarium globosum TaxID=78864 RepID=A0A8H6DL29_9HYPO|nr:hypothetical protein FGLOB1_490 [Fusarium globosum]